MTKLEGLEEKTIQLTQLKRNVCKAFFKQTRIFLLADFSHNTFFFRVHQELHDCKYSKCILSILRTH